MVLLILFLIFEIMLGSSIAVVVAKRVPKLVAFDLDGTIWNPEMFQLWGGGAPFRGDGSGYMMDRSGTKVELIGATRQILHELKNDPQWVDTKVAWVSCTDEPDWADELLTKFKTTGGESIASVAHSNQIFKSNKKIHFQKLKEQFPDIEFEDMLFFDNEMGNIRSVSTLGVKCVYCPDGVTAAIWESGLSLY